MTKNLLSLVLISILCGVTMAFGVGCRQSSGDGDGDADGDAEEGSFSVNYRGCHGQDFACESSSATICCGDAFSTRLTMENSPPFSDCVITNTDGGYYSLSFQIENGEFGIYGYDLQFVMESDTPAPVRSCAGFGISKDTNYYQADSCDTVDVRTDGVPGGGCELRFYVPDDGVIHGQFRCKALRLPAQNQYISTTDGTEISWGEIQFDHFCEFRQ